jgi:hypothetical protein
MRELRRGCNLHLVNRGLRALGDAHGRADRHGLLPVGVFVQPYTTSGAPASGGAPGSATLTAVVAAVAIVALATGLFHCKSARKISL